MLMLLMSLLVSAQPAGGAVVWVEAEDTVVAGDSGAFAPLGGDEAAVLSGGAWVSDDDGGMTLRFEVTAPGERAVFVRKFWKHGPFRWRVDGGDWEEVGRGAALLDRSPVRRHVEASWVRAGSVTLPDGPVRVEVEVTGDAAAAFDCFVFARPGAFEPRGKLRPGEEATLADPGTWALTVGGGGEPAVDLRPLNEPVAGGNGYVTLTPGGDGFLLADGSPVKFWAVTTYVQRRDMGDLRAHAAFLARRGVNMVRVHAQLPLARAGEPASAIDPEQREQIWRVVAAMRDEGIYTTISPYWSHAVGDVPASWDVLDHGDGSPYGTLFFDEKLQAAYRDWWRQLLGPDNPHTGVPLAADPAVALLQLQNEDSLLFWTSARIGGEARRELGRRFAAFAAARHGSAEAAVRAWGRRHEDDDPTGGVLGVFDPWHFTQPDQGPRVDEQLAFYATLMRGFNAGSAEFLRGELGYGGLVNAGNWKTADDARLMAAERWSYAANDVQATNRYYDHGTHAGDPPTSAYAVAVGHEFEELSPEEHPGRLPTNVLQVAGSPMLVTESLFPRPMGRRAGATLMTGAHLAVGGVDGFYWFAAGTPGFSGDVGAKFDAMLPDVAGAFPAAALLARGGLLEEAPPAVVLRRDEAEVFGRKPLGVDEAAGHDPNREADRAGTAAAEAFVRGPVVLAFEAGDDESDLPDPMLVFDAGRFTVDRPKAQVATGRIGRAELGTVTFEVANDYAALAVVPLDGRDVADSRRLLVQAHTTARPHGFRTSDVTREGRRLRRIESLGSWPWNLELLDASVTLDNPHLTTATVLDADLAPRQTLPYTAGQPFKLPADAMYVLLTDG